MHIEVLNTGSELLLGTTLNTHGAWLGQTLFPLGLRIARQTCVPDGEPIREALRGCLKRSDVVLITGGLGPTSDDITRDLVAAELGIELIEDEAALRSLKAYFERTDRRMAGVNLRQAQVPVGATVIPNANGTAPGLYLPPRLSGDHRCALFLLPGPPRELKPMVLDEVLPVLRSLGGVDESRQMVEIRYTGLGESELAERVESRLTTLGDDFEYGYCARPGEVDLRLIGSADQLARARSVVDPLLHEYLISDDGQTVPQAFVREASAAGLTLATAESCTGGLIASRVTDVAGSSSVLMAGYVTYSNEAKMRDLGVRSESLESFGAVSEEVVREMVTGARERAGTDFAVAVSGIAGPDGGTLDKPVGTVWFAWALPDGEIRTRKRLHRRDRQSFKHAVSQEALFEMLRWMREFPDWRRGK